MDKCCNGPVGHWFQAVPLTDGRTATVCIHGGQAGPIIPAAPVTVTPNIFPISPNPYIPAVPYPSAPWQPYQPTWIVTKDSYTWVDSATTAAKSVGAIFDTGLY